MAAVMRELGAYLRTEGYADDLTLETSKALAGGANTVELDGGQLESVAGHPLADVGGERHGSGEGEQVVLRPGPVG